MADDVDLILGDGGVFTPQPGADVLLRLGPPPGSPTYPHALALTATLTLAAALSVVTPAGATLAATLQPVATIGVGAPVQATLAATLDLGASVLLSYRGEHTYVGPRATVPWQGAAAVRAAAGVLPWRDGAACTAAAGVLPWRDGTPLTADAGALPWQHGDALHAEGRTLPWQQAEPRRPAATVLPWRAGWRVDTGVLAAWRDAQRAGTQVLLPWRDGWRAGMARALPWSDGVFAHLAHALPWRDAPFVALPHALPWRDGELVLSHGGWPWPPAPPPPVVQPTVDLLLCGLPLAPRPAQHALQLVLVLGIDQCSGLPLSDAPTWIPIRRVYMITHVVQAVRWPDMQPLEVFGATIAADADSWCWQLQATGPASLLQALAPVGGVPQQMRLTIDGAHFVFAVEGLRRDRVFGRTGASITGRSVTALVGDGYLPPVNMTNASVATAQQLVADALQYSGVALDWGITDWLVPEGAWSYHGTPLAAALRVAEAAGAIVQSHRNLPELQVRPRYPLLPWAWAAATPDVALPSAAVTSEGWERADRPAWDGVYVAGQNQGVLALVKRTGTAGSAQPQMVVDALITDADAARQRGSAILGGAGPQARVRLELPVLVGAPHPGIVDVGRLVEVVDGADVWRGLVRAVTVTAGMPAVRQTLTVERHL